MRLSTAQLTRRYLVTLSSTSAYLGNKPLGPQDDEWPNYVAENIMVAPWVLGLSLVVLRRNVGEVRQGVGIDVGSQMWAPHHRCGLKNAIGAVL